MKKVALLLILSVSAYAEVIRWVPVPGTCNFAGTSGDAPNQVILRVHECTPKAVWAKREGLDTTVTPKDTVKEGK